MFNYTLDNLHLCSGSFKDLYRSFNELEIMSQSMADQAPHCIYIYIYTLAGSLRMQVLCSLKFAKCPTGTFWLKLVAIIHRIAPEGWKKTP